MREKAYRKLHGKLKRAFKGSIGLEGYHYLVGQKVKLLDALALHVGDAGVAEQVVDAGAADGVRDDLKEF